MVIRALFDSPRRQGTPPPCYSDESTRNKADKSTQECRLNPWLGLRARLFLSLISYTLVALLFVGTRLVISSSQVEQNVQNANGTIWNACYRTEQGVSTLAAFPHLLADNFNGATKRSVDQVVHGLGQVLLLSITAIESLLIFLVDSYRGLFLCFLQFVVQAALAILISAVQLFSTAVHDISQSIQSTIQASIDAINATLRTTLGGFNDILKIVGKSIKVPTIAQPDLSALSNVTLPSSLQDNLLQLNNSLPTLNDLRSRVDNLIQAPFLDLKQQINATVTAYSFNQSTLPLPPIQSISYCNETINTGAIQDLSHDLGKIAKVGIAMLVILAVLVILISLVKEWYDWHSLQKQVLHTKAAYHNSTNDKQEHNMMNERSLLSLLQLSTHPLIADWGLRAAEKMGVKSLRGKDKVRWWLAWSCHPVSLFLLMMGVIGWLSVQIQLSAVHRVQSRYNHRFEDMLNSTSQNVQDRIDSKLRILSSNYAEQSNKVLIQAQDDLNQHLFQWVNVTTSTMNNTLNEFMDGIATAINQTFSSTPLYSPVQNFIGCIIGQKVAGIEGALTWMQSQAHAAFPIVPQDALMPSRSAIQQVMQPLQESTTGDNGILASITGVYIRSLEKERIMFVVLVLLYLLLFIIGSVIALFGDTIRPLRNRSNSASPSQESVYDRRDEKQADLLDSDLYSFPTTPSHHSISRPLHPDVVSLYHQYNQSPLPNQAKFQESRIDHQYSINSTNSFPELHPANEITLHRST